MLVRMHATRRQEADDMRRAASLGALGLHLVNELKQRREFGQRSVRDRPIDARQILHDDPAGAEVGMPDLGIAHLTVGQPDIMLAGVEPGMRPAPRQRVPDRRASARDRVVRAVLALSPSVENAQHERARAAGHRSGPSIVRTGFYTFAAATAIRPLPPPSRCRKNCHNYLPYCPLSA